MRRLKKALVIGLAAAAVVGSLWPERGLADEDNIPDILLVVKTTDIVKTPYDISRIVRSSPGDLRISETGRQREFIVKGLATSYSELLIYDSRGDLRDKVLVTVVPKNLRRVMQNVQELLNDIEGLNFKIVNERVYILGSVALDDEMQRVRDLARREPLVEQQVELSPVSQRLIASVIQDDIGVPGVDARLINGQIILEGIVHSEAASRRAEAIARAYYEAVINVLEIRPVQRIPGHAKTVTILVHYVQLAKSMSSIWGFEWRPLMATGVDVFFERDFQGGAWGGWQGSATATVSTLLPRLERAKSSGYARVLENPTVAVKSGDTASLFSGFEYPYLVTTGLVTSVEWKDIGIGLDVTPYAQGNDVDMDLSISVTDLGEVAPNGYQAVDRTTLGTSEFCRAGESIVVGGLQRVLSKVSYNRVPSYDTTGAVFNLYANKDYKKSKSQFLVFLTPKVHESSSSANQEIKDAFNLQEVRQ